MLYYSLNTAIYYANKNLKERADSDKGEAGFKSKRSERERERAKREEVRELSEQG